MEVGFAQGAGVHIAVEEQGLPHEGVVHHEDGDAVEEGAVLVVVGLVPGQGFGVALDELGDEIGAVVPHAKCTAQDWLTSLEWVLNYHKNDAKNTSMPTQMIRRSGRW